MNIPTLPVAISCDDPNPWDSDIRCTKPSGHRAEHYHLLGGLDPQRWTDDTHWPTDDCQPCHHAPGAA